MPCKGSGGNKEKVLACVWLGLRAITGKEKTEDGIGLIRNILRDNPLPISEEDLAIKFSQAGLGFIKGFGDDHERIPSNDMLWEASHGNEA